MFNKLSDTFPYQFLSMLENYNILDISQLNKEKFETFIDRKNDF